MELPVFFSNEGLTSTSANHIANKAKEYVNSIIEELNTAQFYDTTIKIIGSVDETKIELGKNEEFVKDIPNKLEKIYKANSLIAWLREAIKARTSIIDKSWSFEDWAVENKITLPSRPILKEVSEEKIINSLSIKERNRYFKLETMCSVIGKQIHPNGNLSNARKKLTNKINIPCEIRENGRDTVIYKYYKTVSPDIVESLFFELQAKHRKAQAELNGILHNIDETFDRMNAKALADYNEEITTYNNNMELLRSQYKAASLERKNYLLEHTKIVIPNDLKEIYEIVKSL